MKYYGGDQYGRSREFRSRDEFFGMALEGMALNDEYTNDVLDAFAVGESLVMVHVNGHRRSRATQEVLDMDYVIPQNCGPQITPFAAEAACAGAGRTGSWPGSHTSLRSSVGSTRALTSHGAISLRNGSRRACSSHEVALVRSCRQRARWASS